MNTPRVETMAELDEAKSLGKTFVFCICPKCKEGWTSLLSNAKSILEKGCLCCAEEEWNPVIEFGFKNT